MTPLERAEEVIGNFDGDLLQKPWGRELIEKIRRHIVEATNDELEKRRAVEAELSQVRDAFALLCKNADRSSREAIANWHGASAEGRLWLRKYMGLRDGVCEIRRELAEIAAGLAP